MTTTVQDTIDGLVDTTTGLFTPLHEVTDPAKVDALAADMAEHGWRGAPIVTEGGSGGNAFTGVHRIAAVARLLNTEGIETEVPYVDIADLCEQYDIDWAALLDEYDGETYEAAAALRHLLPREVVDYLGLDVDGAL